MKKTFQAKLGSDRNPNLIEIPFDVRETFGRARPAVRVTLDGITFPSTVAVYDGKSYLGIRKDRRDAAGVETGDTVKITMELDDAPRVVTPPPELAEFLSKHKTARAAWDALSFTDRKERALAIESAKKPETRARRLQKTIDELG
ncbi:MAG TPA: YdeI/OmpD-associated family protein [Polyangiales bacterium]|jgi:hypothetical protein|nr:YdeI/OmpD-associated family protein [Polyangiales bacterium]